MTPAAATIALLALLALAVWAVADALRWHYRRRARCIEEPVQRD